MDPDVRAMARRRLRDAVTAFKWLAWGVGTGLAALATAVLGIAVAAICLVGIGLLLVRPWLQLLRVVANLERTRLQNMGHPIAVPYLPLPDGLEATLGTVGGDLATRRDLAWLSLHASWGLLASLFGVQAGVNVVRELTFPLWWRLLPAEESSTLNGLISVSDWHGAWLAVPLALIWLGIFLFLNPTIVNLVAAPGLRLLSPHPDVDLSARVAELTATRAAALDAHAVELRRIERALHDGAQNRLVGVAMLTGAAREAIASDTVAAEEIMGRAHQAAELALAELRAVVRGILPPVLEDRGLAGAVSALAGDCAVECVVEVDVAVRCPASVETTAYFVVAEALTNVSKHSGATRAQVVVRRVGDRLTARVTDDGRGGARVDVGSGLAGIQRRVSAHDGATRIVSPAGGPTTIEVELPCGS